MSFKLPREQYSMIIYEDESNAGVSVGSEVEKGRLNSGGMRCVHSCLESSASTPNVVFFRFFKSLCTYP